jgi:hypothetical protein
LLCYDCSAGWYWRERVVRASGGGCVSGGINFQPNPIPMSDGCIEDEMTDEGNPNDVAPCTEVTLQTVTIGPTMTSRRCTYANTQTIRVTLDTLSPRSGTVVTSSSGPSGSASVSCDWHE